MKAVVVNKPGDVRIVEVEKPKPGPRDVVARVLHCGVCATDISIINGTCNLGEGMEVRYPARIGHEWVGEIVETGSEIKRLKIGDRIISGSGYNCGVCESCVRGEFSLCHESRAIGTIGNAWPGAFAEYMMIPEHLTFRVPDNIPSDTAALVEPAAIGLSGLMRTPLGPGNTLLVMGTGAISMGGMACAKGYGIGKTILAGRKDPKLEIGKRLGADVLVNMEKEDLKSVVMRETNGMGTTIVLDATGAPELLNLSASLAQSGGHIVLPGFYEQPINGFAIDNVIVRSCTIVGAAGEKDIQRRILDLLTNGHVDLSPMITHRYPFSRIPDAFEAMKKEGATRCKIMVDF